MPLYSISIFKGWQTTDIERAWANTYEFSTDAVTPSEVVDVAEAIAAAERFIHLSTVQFIAARVSTWEEETGGAYDPDSFVSVPLSGAGTRLAGEQFQALDYNVCLNVARLPASGRKGHLFYRGVLVEADVDASAGGRFVLPNNWTSGPFTGWAGYYAGMQPFLGAWTTEATTGLAMVGVNTLGQQHRRAVLDLQVQGVTINKRNHRYFDRGGS